MTKNRKGRAGEAARSLLALQRQLKSSTGRPWGRKRKTIEYRASTDEIPEADDADG